MQAGAPVPAFLRFPDGWRITAFAIAMLVVIPLAVVLSSLLHPEEEIWRHLLDYVLPDLLSNTFKLVLGVSLGRDAAGRQSGLADSSV